MRPGKYPQLTDGAWLHNQYVVQQKSTVQIAAEVGCTSHLVGYRLQQHEIPKRQRGGGAITQWSPKQCVRCEKQFTPNGPASKFCPECRHRRPARVQSKPCAQCRNPFKPGSPTAKYCSRECLNASKRYGRPPRLCERCGTEFQPSGPAARYCSGECRSGTRACEHCGKVFGLMMPERAEDRAGGWTAYKRRFCSDECRVAWRSVNLAHRAINSEGYVTMVAPPTEHEDVRDGGYARVNLGTGRYGRGRMLKHRYVMEEHLGRKLLADETVHHISGDKLDNDISNLELWSGKHPKGQRATDLVEYAVEILERYAPKRLARRKTAPAAADGDMTALF